MITITEEDIASFSTENTPPTVSLINPGINTASTAIAKSNWEPSSIALMRTTPNSSG